MTMRTVTLKQFGFLLENKGRHIFLAGLVMTLVLSVPTSLSAQRANASISGTIADSSGAAIPGAKVTAVASATGASSSAVSDAAGFYVLPNLAIGAYSLRVEKEGFQAYVQEGIVLEVDRPLTVNPTLQVGKMTQSVTVTGEASQVNTRTGTVNYEITTTMTRDLPLNGRNVLQLMNMAPDVTAFPSSTTHPQGGPFVQSASRPEDGMLISSAAGGVATPVSSIWMVGLMKIRTPRCLIFFLTLMPFNSSVWTPAATPQSLVVAGEA